MLCPRARHVAPPRYEKPMSENEGHPDEKHQRRPHSRREFLWNTGARFPMLALIDLLSRDGFFRSPAYAASTEATPAAKSLLAARPPTSPPKPSTLSSCS